MSGIKETNLQWFYRSIHERGEDVTSLAKRLNCGRSHLSQVLSGRRSGSQTWRKIVRSGVLTIDELKLLGRDVPRSTNSHVEQIQPEAPSWQATG